MKRAFTLIELLVVIAIIAILAAILFPVFAQAKAAAKKTNDVSNVKQIATSMYMYETDYDDVVPTLISGPVIKMDYYAQLMPYVKSINLFFSPARKQEFFLPGDDTSNVANASCYDGFNPTTTCIGYGFNWGPHRAYRSGLIGDRVKYMTSQGKAFVDIGIPFSQIQSVAETMAFGNTEDSSKYTITSDYVLQYERAQASSLFWGGNHQIGFVDGHAHNMRWRIGTSAILGAKSAWDAAGTKTDNTMAMPSNIKDAYMWCSQPDSVGSNGGFPDGTTCRQAVDIIAANTTWVSN